MATAIPGKTTIHVAAWLYHRKVNRQYRSLYSFFGNISATE